MKGYEELNSLVEEKLNNGQGDFLIALLNSTRNLIDKKPLLKILRKYIGSTQNQINSKIFDETLEFWQCTQNKHIWEYINMIREYTAYKISLHKEKKFIDWKYEYYYEINDELLNPCQKTYLDYEYDVEGLKIFCKPKIEKFKEYLEEIENKIIRDETIIPVI